MTGITLRMWVHAAPETVWSTLRRSMETPGKHAAEALRKETISFDDAGWTVYRELRDQHGAGVKVVVKAVPGSVQNPMAPVDLQYFLELEAGGEIEEGRERAQSMVALLKEEQRQVKEMAEEAERIS